MDIFQTIVKEFTDFFGVGAWVQMWKSGDYSKLATLDGLFGAVGPILPLLLVIELISAIKRKRFKIHHYKNTMLIYALNRVIGRFISIAMVAFCIGFFEPFAILKTTNTWYWFIYGYIVWELAHFVYHYLGHKVRLFWCLHSTHHAPEAMNLTVSFSHFFLEGPYADFIRTTICILLGVNPAMLFLIMFIDGSWGGFIHAGENLIKNGRLGPLERIMLTPSHHRVHHAKNPLYMDTNFCNLLNIWDRVFKTHQLELKDEEPIYGITRPIKNNSMWDVYFGEFVCLFRDVAHAPGIKNKLLYFVMPPGWSHDGNHKTAKVTKKEYLEQLQKSQEKKESIPEMA